MHQPMYTVLPPQAFQLGDFTSLLTNRTVGAELLGATNLGESGLMTTLLGVLAVSCWPARRSTTRCCCCCPTRSTAPPPRCWAPPATASRCPSSWPPCSSCLTTCPSRSRCRRAVTRGKCCFRRWRSATGACSRWVAGGWRLAVVNLRAGGGGGPLWLHYKPRPPVSAHGHMLNAAAVAGCGFARRWTLTQLCVARAGACELQLGRRHRQLLHWRTEPAGAQSVSAAATCSVQS